MAPSNPPLFGRFPDWLFSFPPYPFHPPNNRLFGGFETICIVWVGGKRESGERKMSRKSLRNTTVRRGTQRGTYSRPKRPQIHLLSGVSPVLRFPPPPSSIRPIPNVSAVSKHAVLVGWKKRGRPKNGQKTTTDTTEHQFAAIPLPNPLLLAVFPVLLFSFPTALFPSDQYSAFRRFRNVPYWLGGEKRGRSKRKMGIKVPRNTTERHRTRIGGRAALKTASFWPFIPIGFSRSPHHHSLQRPSQYPALRWFRSVRFWSDGR